VALLEAPTLFPLPEGGRLLLIGLEDLWFGTFAGCPDTAGFGGPPRKP
jgi:hypothetical protein